ncbi:MAG: carbohydrate kinase family protein [Bacteroidales bacterium]|nr:carbohydrate kinase family protein [Bacteroidales bacterium]
MENRNGIISAGNWLVDTIKFIDVYPKIGNLVNIRSQECGLGGCSHNVLVDLAKLKSNVPLFAGGCVGRDDYGKMALDAIKENNIDGSNMIVLDDCPTSYTDVMSELGGGKTRTFFHCQGANARLGIEEIRGMESSARIFHLGYLLLLAKLDSEDPEYGVVAARALNELQAKGYKTSVDVVSEESDRFRKIVLPCLPYTDYLIVNEVEAGACVSENLRSADGNILIEKVEEAAQKLLDAGIKELCVIHFPEGGFGMKKSGESMYVPAPQVPKKDIVSAVGAGDAFCAGTLYAIHEGYSLSRILNFANACARFNLYSPTSTSGAPTLETINNYLNSTIY